MKKFIALVLVLAFLNLVIAPEFASAGNFDFGGDHEFSPYGGAAAGVIVVGAVALIVGLVYLIAKNVGKKTKQVEQKPEEPKPEDINRNIENLQSISENNSLETTQAEQKPGDPNQTIENLQLRTEKDSLKTTQVPKSDGLPVTQSGELVIFKW